MTSELISYNSGYGDGGPGRLGKYYVRIGVGKYQRPKPFEEAGLKMEKYIFLPLPMELRDDTAAGYSNMDTGLLGNIMDNGILAGSNYAAEALRQSGNLITGAAETVGSGVSSVLRNAPWASLAAQISGSIIKDAIPAESITSAISQTTGVSPNPNPSVIFQGPRLREINLNWVLIPTSDKDSKNIRRLVNYLKGAALPRNAIKDSAAILEYPYLAQVNFYPWDNNGTTNKYGWTDKSIIRMKRCFMSSVNVNYTAGNVPAFYEGTNEPVVVSLSINFTEIEYFLANDYDGSNSTASDNLLEYIGNAITRAGERYGTAEQADNVLEVITNAAGT